MLHSNPIVADVISQFRAIEMITRTFANTQRPSATKGLLISGAAGMGKTNAVQSALANSNINKLVSLKGSSVTAAGFFAQLQLAKDEGSVLLLDDVDIIHKTPAELTTILDFMKSATEMTSGQRPIQWLRTTKNDFLKANKLDLEFDFQGSIIWITNESLDDIAKKSKGHWNALNSRFITKEFNFEQHEKVQYTLYLIDECGMLGDNCQTVKGGYPPNIVKDVRNYISSNWKNFGDMTPRNALQIADMMFMYPNDWEVLVQTQMFNN